MKIIHNKKDACGRNRITKGITIALLFVIFSFLAMGSECFAKTIKGYTIVDGSWVYVTIECGEDSYIENGVLNMQPPWKITYPGGGTSSGSSNWQGIPYNFPIITQMAINGTELLLSSEDAFDVDVMDLTGRVFYSASNVTNDIAIALHALLPMNGSYIIRIANKAGESRFMKIIFVNDSIVIAEPFVFDPNKK